MFILLWIEIPIFKEQRFRKHHRVYSGNKSPFANKFREPTNLQWNIHFEQTTNNKKIPSLLRIFSIEVIKQSV
jgi:hypothetical protein